MDQNQPVDNELQKAIDEITNTTSVNPTFSDPVAAPSTLPEGAAGAPIDPVGPFPMPDMSNMPMPDMGMPDFSMADNAPAAPDFSTPAPAPDFSAPAPVQAEMPAKKKELSGSILEVKKSALRDLLPLVDKMNINISQKYRIFRDAYESLGDSSLLEPAYRAAREIADENERAEALLYLVEAIDKTN